MERHGPEVSDLIVDYDPVTLARRDVRKEDVLSALETSPPITRQLVRMLPATDGILDRAEVDGILVRSHLELQRLHEEFRVGPMIRGLLQPLVDLVRAATGKRVLRVVDLGCGVGFIVRWLAAHGDLADVELIGADYNLALLHAAEKLAREEDLRCRFVAANAFALEEPADIVMSTGVLHHFRGGALETLFAAHERSTATAFLHADIRPSRIAPVGAWIFHQARMREPLAKFDGYWSAVRAHDASTLRRAVAIAAPSFALGLIDAHTSLLGLLRIFQVAAGVRREHVGALELHYRHLGRRLEIT